MSGRWKVDTYYDTGDGICRVRRQKDPNMPRATFWDLLNMVYDAESDDPEAMRGATFYGNTPLGGAVSNIFDHDDGSKIIATCEDGKIYEYGTDWAVTSGARATGNSTTSGLRWSGLTYESATSSKDFTILCNGVDAPIKYDPATGATSLGGSSPSTGNYPVQFQGRAVMAAGDVVYFSKPQDCEKWATSDGGRQIPVAPGTDGDITALFPFGDNLFIFKRSSIYRLNPTLTFDLAEVKLVSSNIGCVAHNAIDQGGPEGAENLIFPSSQGVEMVAATDSRLGFQVRNITRWVKPIIDTRNKSAMASSWGLFNIDRREYYFVFPTGTASTPKEWLIGNFGRAGTRFPRWTRANLNNITAGAMVHLGNGEYAQFAGDTNGRIYRMHIESAATFGDRTFTSRLVTPYRLQGAPFSLKEYGWSHIDVDTEGAYTVTANQVLLRPNLPNPPSNRANLRYIGVQSGWGEGYWGEAVWGGKLYAGERIRPPKARRGAGMAHIVSSTNWFRFNGEAIASKYKRDSLAA